TLGTGGTRDDGTRQYSVLGVILRFAVMPMQRHVGLVLGKLSAERLETIESATPRALTEIARLELDPSRLYQSLDKALTELPSSGIETQMLGALAEMLLGLESASWTMNIHEQGLLLEGRLTFTPPTASP
ncbi:MAG: hypothetical protein RBU37_06965, partial [Myxococcota bacterium]|nr:hypothetical protein [Myxococcota bacterium]